MLEIRLSTVRKAPMKLLYDIALGAELGSTPP